jgi:cytochrome b6-f complex iron-sulfur subunit
MKRLSAEGFRLKGSDGTRAGLDRRTFLELCGCAAAGFAMAGCASVIARPVTAIDGRITLRLADYPELGQPNGSVAIQPQGMSDPLFVLRTGVGAYSVLSPICTHRGCTVEVAGDRLECPCHGSMYDRQGKVLQGPAERALTTFAAAVQGDRLVIELAR